ncbi:MAG: GNAT family N-acetyltransferase [Anaerolineae bacterium]|nr:GNAT family N-acetyltransferase [Anaerolineae bacterium]
MTTIRPYRPDLDEPAVLDTWQAALGRIWPIRADVFRRVTAAALPGQRCDHLVATNGEQVIGFIGVQINPHDHAQSSASIMTLIVDPSVQRQGIGTALLNTTLASVQAKGVRRVRVGGHTPRFWPGVPTNLPGAQAFFTAHGWRFDRQDYDLVRDLTDYTIPDTLQQCMESEHITIEPATQQDAAAIVDLQAQEGFGWINTYRHMVAIGDYQDCLVARDLRKGIVGTLIMYSPQSNPQRVDTVWTTLLGDNVGGLNEVGVVRAERGRGIGIALSAWGSAVIRERGARNCLIGWTGLVDFYGKLGYRPWQAYHPALRDL